MIDANYIEARLKDAGMVLFSLPSKGGPSPLRAQWPAEIVHDPAEAYGWHAAETRPPVPSSKRIDDMNIVLDWIMKLQAKPRKIVSARMLWCPIRDRPINNWTAIARNVRSNRRQVKRVYNVAVDRLVRIANGGFQHD